MNAIDKGSGRTNSVPLFGYTNEVLQADKQEFKNKYNIHSFKFNHTLNQSGLFEVPRIAKLARKMIDNGGAANFSATDFRRAALDTKFAALPGAEKLADAIERLGETGTWIKLTRAQDYDADYAKILEMITDDLERLADRPLRDEITWVGMTLLLSSPRISTPFHIDHESNFLFQIRGEKDVCLFDAADRELVTDIDLERFYGGNRGAANYKEGLQNHGTVYRLTPGEVVHHPPLAPHWVKNDDNISVSISVGYCMRALERRARVYQANFMLRKIGLKPASPGRSPMRDAFKTRFISAFELRAPKTYTEIVYSPVDRLRSPLKTLAGFVKH
jgi:hypothetical protein